MELREFVKQALVNIVGAVTDAAAEVKAEGGGAIISPRLSQGASDALLRVAPEDGQGYAFPVKFDLTVTITTSEKLESHMKGRLVMAVLGASAGQQETDAAAKTAVQRIQFSVPVKFPQTPQRPMAPLTPPGPSSWAG